MPIISSSFRTPLPHGGPIDGQIAAVLNIYLQPGEIYNWDFGQIASRAESIYVDATQCSFGIQFDFGDTGRSLVVPYGAELCMPTFSNARSITITNLSAISIELCKAIVFTCHKPTFERFPGSGVVRKYGVQQQRGTPTLTTAYVNPGPYIPALGGTFDPSYAIAGGDPNATISADKLTATVSNSANVSITVPGRSYLNAGKWYLEMDVNASITGRNRFGLGAVSPFTGPGTAASLYNISIDDFDNNIQINSVVVLTGYTAGGAGTQTRCMAIDFTAGLFWYRSNTANAWSGAVANAGNPATGAGGLNIASTLANAPSGALTFFTSCFGSAPGPVFVRSLGSNSLGVVPAGFVAGWPAP